MAGLFSIVPIPDVWSWMLWDRKRWFKGDKIVRVAINLSKGFEELIVLTQLPWGELKIGGTKLIHFCFEAGERKKIKNSIYENHEESRSTEQMEIRGDGENECRNTVT